MTDEKQKERRRKKLNRNRYARSLRDQGDHKGAFRIRKINPKKGGPYKREKGVLLERLIEDE